MKSLADFIVEEVEHYPGIRAVLLSNNAAYARMVRIVEDGTHENYLETVDSLVREGKIIEIEYVHSVWSDRVKSLYFPAGTEITVIDNVAKSQT
jgi:hypothetical protein